MNLGADAWRNHLEGRIAETIERYGVDAYFLDIVGGHVNSTNGDMHEGTRRLVQNLREKYPNVVRVGEMPYDALHGFIPMYQAGYSPRWRSTPATIQHLSSPAPGRGSSGVHESGFAKFNVGRWACRRIASRRCRWWTTPSPGIAPRWKRSLLGAGWVSSIARPVAAPPPARSLPLEPLRASRTRRASLSRLANATRRGWRRSLSLDL